MNSLDDLKHNLTEEKIQNEKVCRCLDIRYHPLSLSFASFPSPNYRFHLCSHPFQSQPISRGPSPNRGSSKRDVEAVGADSEKKRDWQRKHGIDPSKQVRIKKLSHMRYQHPDLNKITTFLRGELFFR